MIFGYILYTIIIIGILLFLFIFAVMLFKTYDKWERIVSFCLLILFSLLLYYVFTSPHVDIYKSHNNINGTVTYTYYNMFQTDSVMETYPKDHYVYGKIISISPERRYVNVVLQFDDGNTTDFTTDKTVDINSKVECMKHYYPTVHYDINY